MTESEIGASSRGSSTVRKVKSPIAMSRRVTSSCEAISPVAEVSIGPRFHARPPLAAGAR